MLNPNNTYSRKSNVIYENDIPIIILKHNFIDIEKLSETVINYMNRFMVMFPDLFEIIVKKEEEINDQLSLF
ncbi:hypothetical protein ACM55H_05300 [Flavobacterium sp. ZT3R17]|uniref:hypothetical protein n=1 Tax=Flavobacterium cryoconiti TaxID=3398736 RepID=UPI003A88C161